MIKKIKKGFTLVELLVVIAIIAILATIIAPNAFKAIEKSKVATVESDYKAIKTAVLSYYADTGAWPGTNAGNSGLVSDDNVNGWNGPYLEKWPTKNPWGGMYKFCNFVNSHGVTCLRMDNVPEEAKKRLKADLDGGSGIVIYDKGSKGSVIDIIISRQ